MLAVTAAQAFWWIFIIGVAYLGLCVGFMVFWSLLMGYNKRCSPVVREFVRPTRHQGDDEQFRKHLNRCDKTVDSWPHWKQNVLGPHKKPTRKR